VLFLDFDGVLNGDDFLRFQKAHVPRAEHRLFDPRNLRALEHLVDQLRIEYCIVSSSWRKDRSIPQIRELLGREGLACTHRITGVTPVLGRRALDLRAAEIAAWIGTHAPERYVVLDDFDLTAEHGSSFFRTDAATGLTLELVEKISAEFR